MKGHVKNALLAIVKSKENFSRYFAEQLFESMNNSIDLARILVFSSEVLIKREILIRERNQCVFFLTKSR